MMVFGLAIELVHRAAIGAFDAAVGGNRQNHARVAVPSFVAGAAAMQRQVLRSDDKGLAGIGHGLIPEEESGCWSRANLSDNYKAETARNPLAPACAGVFRLPENP